MKHQFQKTLIIGLGLMGSSLARDLKKRHISCTVLGSDKSQANIDFAFKNKIIDQKSKGIVQDLKTADLIILAVPVQGIEEILEKWGHHISEEALVVDVGSTKHTIVKAGDQHLPGGNFVGCHPMAGTENSGPQAALENLFQDRPCFIVPGKNTRHKFVEQARELWKALGAHPTMEESGEHDEVMALISHMPQMMASLLTILVLDPERLDLSKSVKSSCRQFLGEGFKDMVRIASSPHAMWRDIFVENSGNLLREVRHVQKNLAKLEKALQKEDASFFEQFMKQGAKLRKGL